MPQLKYFYRLSMILLIVISFACKSDTEKKIEQTKEVIVDKTENAVEKTKKVTEVAVDSATAAASRVKNSIDDEIEKIALEFDAKTSKKIIEDSITGRQIKDYRFTIKEGQRMHVSLKKQSGSPYFNIMEPREEYVAIYNGSTNGYNYNGIAKKNGEYTVRVYMMRSAARRNETAKYQLGVAKE